MVTFKDGPAAGVQLTLERVPHMLRVVRDRLTGKWDALNELEDQPGDDEEIFVYKIDPDSLTRMHVCRGPGSGWVNVADYYHFPEHVPDDVLRSNDKWGAWCIEHRQRILGSG